ncbi:hypothetical protein PIB30_049281 [Stylosanthes scabra]|uniref:Aminotransferase-like plant mobile domain-containing protein n=1 Tax=Stylosanthes scabra TaxID=79078 RepID=A0ABU6YG40_9FABA|nr:hypothetical protein [Stylosanthes scabra]
MFGVVPENASEVQVLRHAQAYIMLLVSTQLDDLGQYSWGSATLAWLYRNLCRASNMNVVAIAGPQKLQQSWIFWRFPSLRPYGFNQFSWSIASRYLPTSDEKDSRVFQYRTMLD